MLNSALRLIIRNLMIIALILMPFSSWSLELKAIDADDLPALVQKDKAEIQFIFLFTSWCSVCKDNFDEVMVMAAKYRKNERVTVMMLSLDDNMSKLEKFVAKYQAEPYQIHYFASDLSRRDITTALHNSGIKYNGMIPHATVLQHHRVLADDNYEVRSVEQFIEYLLTSNPAPSAAKSTE